MKAEFFATLDDKGKIALLTEANPPHELIENQIELTQNEFKMLKAFRGSLKALHRTVHELEKKLRKYEV